MHTINKTYAFVWLMHGVYQELKALIAMIITEIVTFCETSAKCWRGSTVILHSDMVRFVLKEQKNDDDSLWRAQTDCDHDGHSTF